MPPSAKYYENVSRYSYKQEIITFPDFPLIGIILAEPQKNHTLHE